jgi:hypothetical protein
MKHLIAATVLAVLAGPALADTSALQLYDAQGHPMGQKESYAVDITIGNSLYQLEVQRVEGTPSYLYTFPDNFYYTSTNCTGQRYVLDYGEIVRKVYYEEYASPGNRAQQLWTYGSGGPVTINANSYWYGYWGTCEPLVWSPTNAIPAIDLGDMRFYPPYYISRNGSHSDD